MADQPLWLTFLVAFVFMNALLIGMAYMTYFERKVLAAMQDRMGPTRTGPKGLLQPIADGIKLLGKEDLIPAAADKWVFFFAPLVVFVTAIVRVAVIPFGGTVEIFGRQVNLFAADLNVGALFLLAFGSLGVYGIILGAYASANRFSLLGGLRAAAQVVSYEIVLGLSLVGVFLLSQSLSVRQILLQQQADLQLGPLSLPNWFILSQPLAFVIFLIAGIAETNRAPFDLPEAETELVSGFHTEYSAFRFSFYFLGEYINMIVLSLFAATLFLGGTDGPGADRYWGLGLVWLVLKLLFFLFFYVWLRATLPRFRYDQLMGIAWKVLLPLVLVNIMVTAFIRLVGNGQL
ncbi:MAG: NADH-ubiquinone oxidoreductase chain H [uncultured Thermomicrobiales bacterium]|uniref:NADH-quinone oxidoreductase subunit H n=1 Tax=uncultured Thermomicrobiales bacterium TaxID=1645740 RepID=A0A6J4UBR7_9BACT|nr:MAG: NADH-ubiquinone oxidoreductase chain H [uncultured Thermomicrobiales bacterium]